MDKSGPYAIPQHSEFEVSPSHAPEVTSWNYNSPPFPQQQQQYPNVGPPHQNHSYNNGPLVASDPGPSKRKRICGLTTFQLLVLILLLLSIVVGAVLGGVFGSGVLHRSSSSSSTSSNSSPSVAIPNLPDIFSTAVVGGSTRIVTVTPTATTTKSRSYTFASATSSATPTGISAKNCNNGTTYSTTTSPSVGFLILCQIDWPAGAQYGNPRVKDVSWSENVSTLKECMEGCSAWNRDNKGGAQEMCRAVVWNYKEQCYLKNQTGPDPDTFYDYANYFVQAAVLLQSA